MTDIERNFTIWFDPKKGGIRFAAPYDGKRHYDTWQQVSLCNGQVQLQQYEDGQFISLEIFHAGAGLNVDVWGEPTATVRNHAEALAVVVEAARALDDDVDLEPARDRLADALAALDAAEKVQP